MFVERKNSFEAFHSNNSEQTAPRPLVKSSSEVCDSAMEVNSAINAGCKAIGFFCNVVSAERVVFRCNQIDKLLATLLKQHRCLTFFRVASNELECIMLRHENPGMRKCVKM